MSAHGVELAKLRLPAEFASAKIARDLVGAVAGAAGVADDTAYTAKVATSELVTNAARHARYGGPVSIEISRLNDLFHVAVEDISKEPPDFRSPAGLAEGGYGLVVVDDITDECGYHFTALGKAVWFSLKATWALRPTVH